MTKKMKKYENVDIAECLAKVVEVNTEHYKGDYQYDLDKFREAAKAGDGEGKHFFWLSRRNGTECFTERAAYMKDSYEFNAWTYYARYPDEIRAYAVVIKSVERDVVIGDLYELDYPAHIAELKKDALDIKDVCLKYEDGTKVVVNYDNYGKCGAVFQDVISRHFEQESDELMKVTLLAARKAREENSSSATFKITPAPLVERCADAADVALSANDDNPVPTHTQDR
jgi:hypothetical protein